MPVFYDSPSEVQINMVAITTISTIVLIVRLSQVAFSLGIGSG